MTAHDEHAGPKRIAVAGGTGMTGRRLLAALRHAGHEPIAISRAVGVDVMSGEGLDHALIGVDGVVDVLNAPVSDDDAAREFFGTTTRNLLDAEQRAGVGHHLLLSILGVDRVRGNAHYVGCRHQEALVEGGPVPFTILRSAQFHDFAAMVVSWTRTGDTAIVPPLLVQPIAITDVADALAAAATSPPAGRLELAGPRPEDLVDMARRTLARRGDELTLLPSWHDGPFGPEMAGDVLLPGPETTLATTTFDDWLANPSNHATVERPAL